MNSLKKIILSFVILTLAVITYKHFSNKSSGISSQENLPIIAITQIIEHQALDLEREGIIDVLASAGYIEGKTVKILYQNAQGNIGTATQIVSQMISQNPKVVVAISTPSAQTALSSCLAQKIPLVFTAVTDPVGAKLVKDMATKREEPVTGVSDHLPIETQIQLVKDFIPDLKTLGVIYNAGEINSVNMIKDLKVAAEKLNIQIIEATASKTADVSTAATSLVGKVQAVYVPNDNTAVAAMNSIAQIGEKNKLPVFAGDTGSVNAGAIATSGYDRFELGRKAGHLIVKILQGTPAGDLPIEFGKSMQLTLNVEAAKKMGMTVPFSILDTATVVGE